MEANKIDKSNMIERITNFPNQCHEALALGNEINLEGPFKNVVVCGMGGSAISGSLLKSYVENLDTVVKREKVIDVVIDRNYDLPVEATKESLVIIISYSGNTEEAITCYKKAFAKNAKIAIITSGGELSEEASKNKTPIIKIPSGIEPRLAVGYSFIPLLNVLRNSSLINLEESEIKNSINSLKIKTITEESAKLAKKLVNKIPLVYSSERLSVLARYWKNNFNENAKIHAFYSTFPELNHNEIVGYTNMKADFYTLMIQDSADRPKIQKRMILTKEMIENAGGEVMVLKISGESFIAKLLSGILLSMLVSYFLALEYHIDPAPVKMIEDFKLKLK